MVGTGAGPVVLVASGSTGPLHGARAALPQRNRRFRRGPQKRLAVPRPGSDSADFVDVVTFDILASTCGDWLCKGREVAVVGRLRLNEWADQNGERRSRIQVVADDVRPGRHESAVASRTGRESDGRAGGDQKRTEPSPSCWGQRSS